MSKISGSCKIVRFHEKMSSVFSGFSYPIFSSFI